MTKKFLGNIKVLILQTQYNVSKQQALNKKTDKLSIVAEVICRT